MDKIKVTFGYGEYYQEVFSCAYKRITFKQLKNSHTVKRKILDLMEQIKALDFALKQDSRIHACITFGCEIKFVKFPENKDNLSSEELSQKFLVEIEKTYYNMNGAI